MQLDYTTKFSDDDRASSTDRAEDSRSTRTRTLPEGSPKHGTSKTRFTDDDGGVTFTGDVFRGTVSLALEKKLGFK